MSGQIVFFKKNIIDIDNEDVGITVTDSAASDTGESFVDFIRNRRNDSAWMTTDSDDTGNTTLIVDWITERDVKDILLVKHNWKAFTIKYWNGSTYVNFSTPINESTCDDETNWFQFTSVETSKLQIIITATQVANEDKYLFRLEVTEKLLGGQLESWPIIKNPVHSTNKKPTRMLSGKISMAEALGYFSVELSVASWKSDADLTILESIYFRREGILVWLCGGDETQFSSVRIGYRLEDIYLMRPINNYEPEWRQGLYKSGMPISLKLEESINCAL